MANETAAVPAIPQYEPASRELDQLMEVLDDKVAEAGPEAALAYVVALLSGTEPAEVTGLLAAALWRLRVLTRGASSGLVTRLRAKPRRERPRPRGPGSCPVTRPC